MSAAFNDIGGLPQARIAKIQQAEAAKVGARYVPMLTSCDLPTRCLMEHVVLIVGDSTAQNHVKHHVNQLFLVQVCATLLQRLCDMVMQGIALWLPSTDVSSKFCCGHYTLQSWGLNNNSLNGCMLLRTGRRYACCACSQQEQACWSEVEHLDSSS